MPREPGASCLFVPRIEIGMQEADGDRLDAVARHRFGERRTQPFEIGRSQHRAVVFDALRHFEAQMARHQRLGKPDAQIEEVVAALEPDIERVAEALAHEHRRRRAFAFDHRIGHQRGAVDDRRQLRDGDPGLGRDDADALDHGLRRIGSAGQALMRRDLAHLVVEEREIGERAADVDADAVALLGRHGLLQPFMCAGSHSARPGTA